MPEIEMPDGQYLSLTGKIQPDTGGQTRAHLLRNRLLALHTNVEPVLLTMDDTPHYASFRQTLREQGLLVDSMRLLNAFEWYRNNDIDHVPTTGDVLPVIEGFERVEVAHPDGSPYQTRYVRRYDAEPMLIDYLRPDGSVYLRVPAGGSTVVSRLTKVFLVNSKGEPVGAWPTQRAWRKDWILRLLEPDRRAFLICDSRYAIADILPLQDPRLHLIHVVHNIHLNRPYEVNSRVTSSYVPLLTQMQYLDSLVTLTDRQRVDIGARWGATENMDVASHPIDLPPEPDPRPARDRRRFVILARLELQKGLSDAIKAFALVVKEEPDARLDIYGDGSLRETLAKQIVALGLQSTVILHGHKAQATETLWSATGMLLTSRFEGYSLAILEGRSHGCPVVTYDIKYGPREQITNGIDGFLVTPGDVRGLADSVLKLIRDPELAARMGKAAREKSSQQDYRSFLEDWRGILEKVIARRDYRTQLTSVELQVTRLGYRRSGRLPDQFAKDRLGRFGGKRSASAGFRTAPMVQFAGRLKLVGKSQKSTLDDVRLTLDAVNEVTGESIPLPLLVKRSGKTFRLSSDFNPAQVFAAAADAGGVRLRLRLIWRNSCWETMLARPPQLAPRYELTYAGDGTLSLLHGSE